MHFKGTNAKITGFDNIKAIDKYRLKIDSVGYSAAEIAKGAIDIINGEKCGDIIVNHFIKNR